MRIAHLLPGRVGHVGGTARDNRLFEEAVLYRYRAGIPWPGARWAMPEHFGDGTRGQRRFSRWAVGGVWRRVVEALGADADDAYAMRVAMIVRAHQHSAGARKKGAAMRPSGTAGAG